MNPGDEVTISGMLNGLLPQEGIVVSGRVAGMETFVRLPPPEQGPTAELFVSSLVHESRRNKPMNPEIDVKVFVLPKFLPFNDMVPCSEDNLGISTRLDGAVVKRMHQVSFHITNYAEREVDLSQWLRFAVDTETFLHLLEMRCGETLVDVNSRSQFVEWDSRSVGIRAGRLAPGDSVSATFITEGAVDSVEVTARPEAVQDVQIARMKFPDAYLDAQLAEMAPRVMLASPAILRGFLGLRAFTTRLIPR